MALQLNAKLPLGGKIAVGAILSFLVAAGYYVVLHTEVSTKIDSARAQTASLEAQLTAQKQAQATYFADRDELSMRQQRQRDLNKVLPADTEAASFLSAL